LDKVEKFNGIAVYIVEIRGISGEPEEEYHATRKQKYFFSHWLFKLTLMNISR
jgi:hypothetical protein